MMLMIAADAVAFQHPDQDLIVNIKEPVDAMVKVVEASGQKITDFNKGNIKARQRMVFNMRLRELIKVQLSELIMLLKTLVAFTPNMVMAQLI